MLFGLTVKANDRARPSVLSCRLADNIHFQRSREQPLFTRTAQIIPVFAQCR